ncbi:hypothetical protein C7451_11852 [Blastomonas natatoria]|uniref:Cyclic GMP-AMP synthase n=1 Tax=Blastomonas natatoria TaxID=34015 RepID=A0A2V3UPX7_9SPHN|nr:hypothetical protein [Blastomonas natatoria]PXW68329.1 hypothetical protein C7451_11852 [Blastomonas natatoria]
MFDTSLEVSEFHAEEVALPNTERTEMRRRRDANRTRLKHGLAKAEKPAPIGQHTQGSYAMRTMVQDSDTDYDIDDGVYFRKDLLVTPQGGEMSALAVRQMICDALQDDRFNKAPTVLKNCVRVFYNEGFHVDVPAYRRVKIDDPWTGQKSYSYELASSDWKASDAKAVTKWFKDRNEAHSFDFDENEGQFCRVVRLLKAFARSRSSWKSMTATGFMLTKLTDECFFPSAGRDDLSLRETMKAIRWRLAGNTIINHPTLNNDTITHDNDARPGHFRDRLIENLKHLDVLDRYDCTHEEAMAAWDKVFCSEWFRAQPAPDGERGNGGSVARESSAPTAPVIKRGGGRYASRHG